MWDLRRGQKFPTVIRKIFDFLEDQDELISTREIKKAVLPRIQEELEELSTNTVNSVLHNLGGIGYLEVERGKNWRQANAYRLSDLGREWWEKHKGENDWGYGVEWREQESDDWWALDTKLWKAVNAGKSVVIGLPCSADLWGDLNAIAKSGQVEIVVRLKRKG